MTENFHTHTFRCSHASGKEREYIETAIKGGIKVMGFSDHAPCVFPDGYESGFRVQQKDVKDYFDTLNALKEEYKDKIEIHIGFEMEYYPLYFKSMLENVCNCGAEYLILGQHFLGNEYPNGYGTGDSEERLCEYTQTVISAIESTAFTYIAHPDIVMFTGSENLLYNSLKKICISSKEHNIPLEINFLGIRDNRWYPKKAFFKAAGEVGCPVVFGFDAHNPEAAFDGESLVKAQEIVKEYSLNLIEHINIISPQKALEKISNEN